MAVIWDTINMLFNLPAGVHRSTQGSGLMFGERGHSVPSVRCCSEVT